LIGDFVVTAFTEGTGVLSTEGLSIFAADGGAASAAS